MSDKNYLELRVQLINDGERGRRELHAGIEHAVYPVVLLVEGVHHGMIGDPVFYPGEVISQSAQHWNRVPVPVHHPQDNTGQFVLCNGNPEVVAEWGVGWIENPVYVAGKLKADMWVNIQQAEEKHPGLIEGLDNGDVSEVSTGLLAAGDGEPGTWNGEEYSESITEIIPDHLALLPGQVGACSWDDGCGIRANQNGDNAMKIKLKLNETNTVHLLKRKMLDYLVPMVNQLSHQQIADLIYSHVDGLDVRKSNGEGYEKVNFVRAIFDDYFVYEERAGEERTLYRQDYIIDDDSKLVLENNPIKVKEDVQYIPINNARTEEGMSEKQNKEKRPCCEKKVNGLIENEATAFTEDDREFLSGLDEDALDKIVNSIQVQETAQVEEPDAGEETAQVNEGQEVTLEGYLSEAPAEIKAVLSESIRVMEEKRASLIQTITNHEANKFTEDQLKAMETAELEGIAALIPNEQEPAQDGGFFGVNSTFVPKQNTNVPEPYVPRAIFNKQAE